MEVQSYLRSGKTLENLKADYAISSRLSTCGKLVILNYDQIKSPKREDITKECRQLVLETGTWDVVAKSFTRFLNYQENQDEDTIFFNSDKHIFHSKEDGSIIMVFWYQKTETGTTKTTPEPGSWYLVTRSTFGDSRLNPKDPLTFRTLFESAVTGKEITMTGTTEEESEETEEKVVEKTTKNSDPVNVETLNSICKDLDKEYSYIFELCTKANIVVRYYEKPAVYLLAAFSKKTLKELDDAQLLKAAKAVGVQVPETHDFKKQVSTTSKMTTSSTSQVKEHKVTPETVFEYLGEISGRDKTFEGLVGKVLTSDGTYLRIKFKTDSWLELHHLVGMKAIHEVKNHLPVVLDGEIDELVSHPVYSSFKTELKATNDKVLKEYSAYEKRWEEIKDIETQKDFALTIKNDHWKSLFFAFRKSKEEKKQGNKNEEKRVTAKIAKEKSPTSSGKTTLRDIWREYKKNVCEILLKKWEKEKK